MTGPGMPLLLLSGAGMPPWVWDRTRELLDAEHPSTVAPRPGPGRAGLADYAAAALDAAPWPRFAVVAHSAGGVVGARLLAAAPDRVSAFLGVSAVVPRPGDSFVSALPLPARAVLSVGMRLAGTRPPAAAIRAGLGAGLPEPEVERLVQDYVPESQRFYRDRLPRDGAGRPTRCGYVLTSRDRELRPVLQRKYAQHLGSTWHAELSTGHLPMLERPRALAVEINRFLAETE